MNYVTTFYEFGYGNNHTYLEEIEGILPIPMYVGMQITIDGRADDFTIERFAYYHKGSDEKSELRIILKALVGSDRTKFRDKNVP